MMKPSTEWLDQITAAAAGRAARRELASVQSAIALGQPLAGAYIEHARHLQALGIDAQAADLYCMSRLRQHAAAGIPSDDLIFFNEASTELVEILKGIDP